MNPRLRVDPVACDGAGLCAELLPELVSLDDWGYPMVVDGEVPAHLVRPVRRAVSACPRLALVLRDAESALGTPREAGRRHPVER
jgi:ferredoxin